MSFSWWWVERIAVQRVDARVSRAGTRARRRRPARHGGRRQRQLHGGRAPGRRRRRTAAAGGRRNRSRRSPWPAARWRARRGACACSTMRSGRMQARTGAPTGASLTLMPVSTRPSVSTMPQRSPSAARAPCRCSIVLSPMKPATKRFAGASYMRSTVSICWIAPSLNTATRSRHRQRLALVVRDVDEGHAELPVQLLQLDLHVLAQLLVERAERLVHQHQLRLEHQRARQRHALLLAAGELRRQRARAMPSRRTMSSARATRVACSVLAARRAR